MSPELAIADWPLEGQYYAERFEAAFCLWYVNIQAKEKIDLTTQVESDFSRKDQAVPAIVSLIAKGIGEHLAETLAVYQPC